MRGTWTQIEGGWVYTDFRGCQRYVANNSLGGPQYLNIPGYGVVPLPTFSGGYVVPTVGTQEIMPRPYNDALTDSVDRERRERIAADVFQRIAKNYDALRGPRPTGVLTPETPDPDAGKDVPVEAIPERPDEPQDPMERPLTKAILDEWLRRWV